MDLNPIIDRLLEKATSLKHVAGVMDLAAAGTLPTKYPVAFVLPQDDSAGPNTLANKHSQRVQDRFAILLAVRNVKGRGYKKAQDELETVRVDIRAAILAWEPAAGFDEVHYQGGQLVQIDRGIVWWQDLYMTAHYERVI